MAKQPTLEAAERVIEASKKKAEEVGVAMCVAVHDGGANLVALVRMDGPCWPPPRSPTRRPRPPSGSRWPPAT